MALGGFGLAMLVAGVPSPALADAESWNALDVRIPIAATPGGLKPNSLRVWSEARFGVTGALTREVLRAGPIWTISKDLSLAVHGTVSSARRADGLFDGFQQLEVEPTWRGRFLGVAWSDRSRAEWRFQPNGNRWRYRNQLRIAPRLVLGSLEPFASEELIWDLAGAGLNETRTALGAVIDVSPTTRLEIGYLLRVHRAPSSPWDGDHIIRLTLTFEPPGGD